MFGSHPFDRYSELDVRENIIRPLLVQLGYSPEMVRTQHALKYPFQFLGHKKGEARDRPLRGEVDYLIDVDKRLSWVIEAKRPGEITEADRQQARTYAAHPEVGAVIFAVITGNNFEFFQTSSKYDAAPILAFTYAQLAGYFQRLRNTVGPEAIRRDYPVLVIDDGNPLAPGLRSSAIVENGKQTYTESHLIGCVGTTVHFTGGHAARRKTGGISVTLRPSHSHVSFTEFSAAINATEVELFTADETLSFDPLIPTIFTSTKEVVIHKGTPVPSFSTHLTAPIELSIAYKASVEVSGYMKDRTFVGSLIAISEVNNGHARLITRANIEFTLR